MIDTKELRRLAQAATPGPWKLLPVGDKSECFAVADINFLSVLTVVDECGTSFGAVYLDGDAKFIAAANPTAVSELLDRLDAAESDAFEQARLNGMGGEREAALMAKLEAAEQERDELRARIEEMEKQEPEEWRTFDGEGGYDHCSYADNEDYQLKWDARNPNHAGWVEPLYLAPGAQPAPSIPEVDALAQFIREIDGAHRLGAGVLAERIVAWLAAAPEAKP